MLLHSTPLFRIYFGDAKDELLPKDYLHIPDDKTILDLSAFSRLKSVMRLDRVVFLKQVHSADGMVISSKRRAKGMRSFTVEGDYLVTNAPRVGLGVMTADCLPIVFYDYFHQVVAIAHAGWRGSVKNIALKTVDTMKQHFGTKPEQLRVFFGPSAKVCCYEVGQDMLEHLEDVQFIERVVQRRDNKLFFDLPGFNKLLLEGIGVKPDSFRLDYNICTICDKSFYSYRREGKDAGRQMTVVSLS